MLGTDGSTASGGPMDESISSECTVRLYQSSTGRGRTVTALVHLDNKYSGLGQFYNILRLT